MRLSKVHGVIRRRLLVNFRIDPDVAQAQLPKPFRPKLHDGYAVGGICLIRLEEIRPRFMPRLLGLSSENAAHRFAVRWTDDAGEHEGVYIPRRDSGSLMNHLAGGRLFSGEHHRATFTVTDADEAIDLRMQSADGAVSLHVAAAAAPELTIGSIFDSVARASAFFEPGSLGFSPLSDGTLEGTMLRTHEWAVRPLRVDAVESSWFADASRFPPGSITFDCALLMRNIAHEWEAAGEPFGVRRQSPPL
jgi:Uncharacterized conserved protein (COG2071)